jgi:hypothetical protein
LGEVDRRDFMLASPAPGAKPPGANWERTLGEIYLAELVRAAGTHRDGLERDLSST